MIKVENITKKFVRNKTKKEKEEFFADKDITFEAKDGEIIGILGPNRSRQNNIIKNDCRNIRTNRRKNYF